jgi:hypothetical protein
MARKLGVRNRRHGKSASKRHANPDRRPDTPKAQAMNASLPSQFSKAATPVFAVDDVDASSLTKPPFSNS